jgi:endonuclease/exonuclease/phosphatase family metal-dependent hydrolase
MLDIVSTETRARISAGAADAETHARLMRELRLDELDVSVGEARAGDAKGGAELRVVAWNMERCKHVAASAELLRALEPDVVLLTEMDWGMARSGQLHTTREFAAPLGLAYVYGVEFLELGHGNEQERRDHAGEANAVGFHGNAILSRVPLREPALIRLDAGGQWFDGARGERRVGGRMAIAGTLPTSRGDITLASVHLESHSDPEHRADQVRGLLGALERRSPAAPVLIAGDLNTFSIPHAELVDRDRLRAALDVDRERLKRPERYEPLFEHARAGGFDWEACNEMGERTGRFADEERTWRAGIKIDWFLTRGLRAREPEVIDAVGSAGRPLSDHELISVRVALGG